MKQQQELIHFFQETGYTCACAVARMLLHTRSIKMSELEIELEMKVVEGKGASTTDLMDFLREHEFEVTLFHDSSIQELSETKGQKLLLFSLDGEIPHVAIIRDISGGSIRLFDPSEGKSCMSLKAMESIWFTDENKKSFILLS